MSSQTIIVYHSAVIIDAPLVGAKTESISSGQQNALWGLVALLQFIIVQHQHNRLYLYTRKYWRGVLVELHDESR